jgi:hypothetical protein
MARTAAASVLVLSLAVAGCGASLPGLTTGSLFGGEKPAAPQVTNDPVSRAMQVGTTSARALKCGYNFDPAKLRANFIAAESATNPADAQKIAQIYDTAFNGISKAVATQGDAYCSPQKTRTIKEALNRHLAGDYTPDPPAPVVEDEGLFGSLGSSSSSSGLKMKHPMDNSD